MKKTKIFLLSAALIFLYNCNGADINVISESGTIESTEVTVSSKVVGEVKKILFLFVPPYFYNHKYCKNIEVSFQPEYFLKDIFNESLH